MTNADQPMWRRILLGERLSDGLLVQRMELRELHMRAGYVPGAHIHNGPVFGPGTATAGQVLLKTVRMPPECWGCLRRHTSWAQRPGCGLHRRDRLGGILHEYRHAVLPTDEISASTGYFHEKMGKFRAS